MGNMLIIGDAHLKVSNLDNGRKFLRWLQEVVETKKPDTVVCLGDFFDGHSVLRAEIMAEYRKFIDFACCDKKLPYFHVLGNHEFYRPNDSTYHALQALKGVYPNFTVIDSPVDIDNLTFVPYCPLATSFPTKTQEIVFAHQSFVGADFTHGYRPVEGVGADTVDAEKIISGHIHRRQDVGKVFFPGSPFAQGVDDADQNKGVFLFDPATYALEFVESPLPRWKTYTFCGPLTLDSCDILTKACQQHPDDHWIVNLSGPRAEVTASLDTDEFKTIKDQFSLRIRATYTDREKERVKIKAITPVDAVNQYIDQVYDGNLDKDMLKTQATDLLRKAGS
jgi:DNA repair exonuclease SbcCD nuclease subunit